MGLNTLNKLKKLILWWHKTRVNFIRLADSLRPIYPVFRVDKCKDCHAVGSAHVSAHLSSH